MTRTRTIVAASLIALGSLAAALPVFQEMQMPRPTQHHAMIQKGVGEWEGTITMFVPGMPEVPTPATESVRSAGPFWTLSTFRSEFMGQAYEGHGSQGYDPQSGKFVSTWLDSLSSFLSVMEGTYDDATKTMTTTWEAPDMTGTLAPHRAERTFSEDAYAMTFYTSGAKTMFIEMKRVKGRTADGAGVR